MSVQPATRQHHTMALDSCSRTVLARLRCTRVAASMQGDGSSLSGSLAPEKSLPNGRARACWLHRVQGTLPALSERHSVGKRSC